MEHFLTHSVRPVLPWYQSQEEIPQEKNHRLISLMDTKIKILNKWLVNQIQQYLKRSIYHDQGGFIPQSEETLISENQLM